MLLPEGAWPRLSWGDRPCCIWVVHKVHESKQLNSTDGLVNLARLASLSVVSKPSGSKCAHAKKAYFPACDLPAQEAQLESLGLFSQLAVKLLGASQWNRR